MAEEADKLDDVTGGSKSARDKLNKWKAAIENLQGKKGSPYIFVMCQDDEPATFQIDALKLDAFGQVTE